jgi:hypothetical protein
MFAGSGEIHERYFLKIISLESGMDSLTVSRGQHNRAWPDFASLSAFSEAGFKNFKTPLTPAKGQAMTLRSHHFFFLPPIGRKSFRKATWRSGDAAACKAVYAGSIPAVASNFSFCLILIVDKTSRRCCPKTTCLCKSLLFGLFAQ